MKYISAQELVADIQSIINSDHPIEYNLMEKQAYNSALNDAINLIYSLQQEIELPEKYQTPDWLWKKLEQPQVADASKMEQPGGGYLEYWLEQFGMPKENIVNCANQIAQGYGARRYLEGVQVGAEAVNELGKREKGYDEAYLNECIAKASKTWEGVDADKYLDEVRGREQEQPEIKSYIEELLKECAGKDGEYYRSRRETLAHLFAYLGGNPSEYMLQPVKQPEVNLEKEITRWLCEGDIADINFDDYDDADIEKTARHFYEFGKNSK